jgi:hypothetical protein
MRRGLEQPASEATWTINLLEPSIQETLSELRRQDDDILRFRAGTHPSGDSSIRVVIDQQVVWIEILWIWRGKGIDARIDGLDATIREFLSRVSD